MRIYAQRPGRIALQVLADLAMVGWVVVVVVLARTAQSAILALDTFARRISGAGGEISQTFDQAARNVANFPVIGPDLSRALSSVTDTGDSLSQSGNDLGAGIVATASHVAEVIIIVGIVPVLVTWLALRVRWVLKARSARRADPELLALNALVSRPADVLHRINPEPAAAWRQGDRAAVAALADAELAGLGLRAAATRRTEQPVSPSP